MKLAKLHLSINFNDKFYLDIPSINFFRIGQNYMIILNYQMYDNWLIKVNLCVFLLSSLDRTNTVKIYCQLIYMVIQIKYINSRINSKQITILTCANQIYNFIESFKQIPNFWTIQNISFELFKTISINLFKPKICLELFKTKYIYLELIKQIYNLTYSKRHYI